MLNHTCLELAV